MDRKELLHTLLGGRRREENKRGGETEETREGWSGEGWGGVEWSGVETGNKTGDRRQET